MCTESGLNVATVEIAGPLDPSTAGTFGALRLPAELQGTLAVQVMLPSHTSNNRKKCREGIAEQLRHRNYVSVRRRVL